MAEHLVSPYWAVKHRRPRDYEFFLKMQPPVVKIMDGGRPDYEWVRKNLPNAILVMRDWLIDDNNGKVWEDILRDPVGTGKRVAQEMVAKAKSLGLTPENVLLMGPSNEPNVWVEHGIDAAVKSTVAFADELARLGWRGLLLNLSVGWPANNDTATVKDTPPNWEPYKPVEAAIKRGNHVLGLHEYWKSTGVADGWGWYGGRALKCPWDVPIIIGECSYSYAVGRSGVPTREQGWKNHITREQLADQIVEYHNRMAVDSRILGLCLFLCDYAAGEWETKDIEPAYDQIVNRKSKLVKPATEPMKPPVVSGAKTTVRVNIRAGAGIQHAIVRTVDAGTVVKPVAKNAVGDWLKLDDGNWIYAVYVSGAPANLPVEGVVQPDNPSMGKGFRFPLDSLRVTQKYSVSHGGIDYGVASGTPVKACADGIVIKVADDRKTNAKNGGYGLYCEVRHPQLKISTFYAHLSRQDVKVGDKVKIGQTVGLSGNTGNSTGAHLHWELRLVDDAGKYDKVTAAGTYNARVNPLVWMAGFKASE